MIARADRNAPAHHGFQGDPAAELAYVPWLKFDPKTGTFQGKPPAGIKGELKVNVSVPQADGTTKTVPMRFSGQ